MKLKCVQYNMFFRSSSCFVNKKNEFYYGYSLIKKANLIDSAGMSLILDSSKYLCILPRCLILQSKIIPDMSFHFSGN